MQAVDSATPPLNLVLGAPALALLREKLAALTTEIDQWETVTLGADFPDR